MLRLRNMTAVDATGLQAILDLADVLRRSGRTLLLCGEPVTVTASLLCYPV